MNKQLNFVQHIFSSLKMHGRAAVVLHVIAAEIIEDLQAALDQLKELEGDLQTPLNS